MRSKGIKAAVGSMFGWPTIRDSGVWMATMARAVSPFRRRTGRNETFAGAMRRLDVDDESVERNRHNFSLMMHIHGVAAVSGSVMVARAFAADTGTGFGWIGFAVLNGALAFTFGFRAWQIAARRLGSVREFVRGGDAQ